VGRAKKPRKMTLEKAERKEKLKYSNEANKNKQRTNPISFSLV
jgi:hypothetical protein